MKFSEESISQGYYVSGYDQHVIHVSGNPVTSSFIISTDQLIENWSPGSIEELCVDHFDQVIQLQPELVLLGTGAVLKFPAIEQYSCLIQQNIGVEIMDTFAACRTYNILSSEGRKVVAGIIRLPTS